MRPIREYLFEPDPSIGGAIVPLVGMPGCGKTVALTQIGLRAFNSDHVVLWRGTKQAQWANFLANDVPVTVWNHEGIEDFEAFVTAKNPGEPSDSVDLEEKGVEFESWESAEELVAGLKQDRVNIVNVPGLQGDTGQTDYHLYFFRMMWHDIVEALIDRQWLRFVTFIGDEWGDVMPCQQQLRKPFYSVVAEMFPPKLSQLRKQNCFLYGAGHSTHDLHYFFWKIKSNSIIYMSGANVKDDVSPEIKQSIVSRLGRGEFVMPPKDKEHFELSYETEDLGWVPEDNYRRLRLDWTSDAPDRLGEEEEGQRSEMDIRKEVARSLYESDSVELSQQEIADGLDVSQQLVSKVVNA